MANMKKYGLTELLALCKETDTTCRWTSQSTHCRKPRSNRHKRLILCENPRNRPKRHSIRLSRPGKKLSFAANNAGFVQFLKQHSSPKHQRVTAGGRIVPMQPPYEDRLGDPMNPVIVAMNGFEPIVGQVFVRPSPTMNIANTDGAGNIKLVGISTEQLDNAEHAASLPLMANELSHQKGNSFVSRRVEHEPSFIRYIQEPQGADAIDDPMLIPGFPPYGELHPVAADDPYEQLRSRMDEIQHIDSAIQCMWHYLKPMEQSWPPGEFHYRFAQGLISWSMDAVDRGEYWLREKIRAHEGHLAEVNRIIAMDTQCDNEYYSFRVWDITERANLLAVIDFLEGFRASRHKADVQPAPVPSGGSNMDSQPLFEPAGNNRSIDIIDPETGRPIVIDTERTCQSKETPGTERKAASTKDGASETALEQCSTGEEIQSENTSCRGKDPDDRTDSLSRQDSTREEFHRDPSVDGGLLGYDGASDTPTWVHEEYASTLSNGANGQSTDDPVGESSPAPADEGIPWAPQEYWNAPPEWFTGVNGIDTAPPSWLTQINGSETLPRIFARPSFALPLFSEPERYHGDLESASDRAFAGSPMVSSRSSSLSSSDWNQWDQRDLGPYNQSAEDNLSGSTLVGSTLDGDDVSRRLRPLEEAPREYLIGLRVIRNIRRDAMREASCQASIRDRSTGDGHDGEVSSDRSMAGGMPIVQQRGITVTPGPANMPSSPVVSSEPVVASGATSVRRSAAGTTDGTDKTMVESLLGPRRRHFNTRGSIHNISHPVVASAADRDRDEVSTVLGLNEPDIVVDRSRRSRVIGWVLNHWDRLTAPAVVNTSRINVHARRG